MSTPSWYLFYFFSFSVFSCVRFLFGFLVFFSARIFASECINAFLQTSTPQAPVALILQLYGAGNAPSGKTEFIQAIKHGLQQGAVIVVTSQCLRG